MNLIEIFKAGKRKDANGVEVNLTSDDLQKAVKAYDVNTFEAPVVIGHPEHNHPAYAWVKELHLDGDVLKAELHQIDPEFAEIVEKGRYKKVSASFYLPDSENNPKKGALYLRHVGFLGAMAPAVKGLKNPIFAENEQGIIDFSDYADELSELEKIKAENEQLKQALRQRQKEDLNEFTEKLMDERKLFPGSAKKANELLNFAEKITNGDVVEFSEDKNLLTLFKDFLANLPVNSTLYWLDKEIATPERAYDGSKADAVKYAENTPYEMIELDQEIRTYATKHKLTYTEAFNAIHNREGK